MHHHIGKELLFLRQFLACVVIQLYCQFSHRDFSLSIALVGNGNLIGGLLDSSKGRPPFSFPCFV